MSPFTTAARSPDFTSSPSFFLRMTSVSGSRSLKTRSKTSIPQRIPSCFTIRSTVPCVFTGITEFVVTSSLEMSSSRALLINLSTFRFIVMGSILLLFLSLLSILTVDLCPDGSLHARLEFLHIYISRRIQVVELLNLIV